MYLCVVGAEEGAVRTDGDSKDGCEMNTLIHGRDGAGKGAV